MKEQKVKVNRAFMLGKRLEVGDIVSVPLQFAIELRTANKVEFVVDPPPKQEVKKEEPVPTAPPTPVTPQGGKPNAPQGAAGQKGGHK